MKMRNNLQKLYAEFAWEWKHLSQADTVSDALHVIDKDVFRESISNVKNGKIDKPSVLVSYGRGSRRRRT